MSHPAAAKEIVGNYYLCNGQVLSLEVPVIDSDSNQQPIYEVLRVFEGVPLFFQEHFDRLKNSVTLSGFPLPIEGKDLLNQVLKLICLNRIQHMNLKIELVLDRNGSLHLYLYFVATQYPPPEAYIQGVSAILYQAVRQDPNIKRYHAKQRNELNQAIAAAQVYEALLVNQRNEITEGSRSNIFFVKDTWLITPPLRDVLGGITRNRTIYLCDKLKINVVEEAVSTASLQQINGLFITGTSPKILPVCQIDSLSFQSAQHPLIRELMEAYDQLIDQEVRSMHA